jgi:hypothetical protein
MRKFALHIKADKQHQQQQRQVGCCTGAQIVSYAFMVRNAIHKLHLKTKSYAEHKALNEYYEEIVTLVDSFAESYQGRYGIIQQYPQCPEPATDSKKLILNFRSFLDEVMRTQLTSELKSELDNIQSLNNKVLYLLELS